MLRYQNFIIMRKVNFIARFKSIEDRNEVVQKGPYTIFSAPLFIGEWSPDFVIKDDLIRVVPLWVVFPHLWGQRSLSKIASSVGKPVTTDECKARKLRVSHMLEYSLRLILLRKRKGILALWMLMGGYSVRKLYMNGCLCFVLFVKHWVIIMKEPVKPAKQMWKQKPEGPVL